ncbi:MAG: hypothetical protein J3K34DRAFT_518776 [Monoraphidium minutum]|nr:MAG: hypothetical protein J3K34DRAFT_518776 [Monoraphidium minutum]
MGIGQLELDLLAAPADAAPPPDAEAHLHVLAQPQPQQHAGEGEAGSESDSAEELMPPIPTDALLAFEQKLEADIVSVFLTLTAVTGVIIFWRGVWSLLDHFMGDSVLGDICCIIVGLTIVLWIRLSGAKVATSFWPPG